MGARVHLKQVWEPNFHLLPWLRDSPKPTEPCLWPPAANSMHPALAYSSPHQCIDCQEIKRYKLLCMKEISYEDITYGTGDGGHYVIIIFNGL